MMIMMIIVMMIRNQLNFKCHDRKCFQSLRNEQDNVNEWKSLVAHCNLVKVSPTIPMMDLPPF